MPNLEPILKSCQTIFPYSQLQLWSLSHNLFQASDSFILIHGCFHSLYIVGPHLCPKTSSLAVRCLHLWAEWLVHACVSGGPLKWVTDGCCTRQNTASTSPLLLFDHHLHLILWNGGSGPLDLGIHILHFRDTALAKRGTWWGWTPRLILDISVKICMSILEVKKWTRLRPLNNCRFIY